MLTAEYWRTHRCPWCDAPGMFTHWLGAEVLECDACGTGWDVRHVAEWFIRGLMEMVGA